MTITSNTLKRSSCSKCVEVLQELVAGLQQQHDDGDDNYYHRRRHTTANYDRNGNSNNTRRNTGAGESSPLSLLKAIARSSHQQRTDYDRYGQQKLSRRSQHHHYHHEQQQHQKMPQQKNRSLLKIEDVEDGVRLTIPVETTAPTMMKQWTRLRQPYTIQGADDDGDTIIRARANSIVPALATSVRINDDNSVTSTTPTSTNSYNDDADDDDSTTTQRTTQIKNPLTIELYCRKCSQKGPEAGARAFLMGPEPLSIVLCHNRIQSDRDEIEEILTHELIHLYDVQTLQLDLTDCETVAYSEIRAAREAECARYSPYRNAAKQGTDQHRATTTPTTRTWNTTNKEPDSENHPQNLPSSLSSSSLMQHVPNIISERWTKAQQSYCIQNIALGAVQNMFPQRGKGKRCLNQVWTKAYNDHRPFHNDRFFHDHHNNNSKDQNQSLKGNYPSPSVKEEQTKCSGTIHGTSGK